MFNTVLNTRGTFFHKEGHALIILILIPAHISYEVYTVRNGDLTQHSHGHSNIGCAYDRYVVDLTLFDGNALSDFEGLPVQLKIYRNYTTKE